MRVAALDLSLTASGVADNFGGAPRSRVITTKLRGDLRLLFLQKQIDEATAGADVVLREGYALGAKNQAGIHAIAELGGVIRLTMFVRKRPLVWIPPATLKKLATGKGNAPKEAMLQAAWQRLGYEGHDHNEADALWLLQAALHKYRLPGAVQVPKTHLDALVKVDWPEIRA